MERLKELLKEVEGESTRLVSQRQSYVAQIQRMQQEVQKIDARLIALSGKADAYRELSKPQVPKKVTPGKRTKK